MGGETSEKNAVTDLPHESLKKCYKQGALPHKHICVPALKNIQEKRNKIGKASFSLPWAQTAGTDDLQAVVTLIPF